MRSGDGEDCRTGNGYRSELTPDHLCQLGLPPPMEQPRFEPDIFHYGNCVECNGNIEFKRK
jgi:hypothetical protein